MSDSEDDYMSEKLVQTSRKVDIRPGLLFSKAQKRKQEVFNKQIEDQTGKRRKSYQQQEKEIRDKGLHTALSTHNVGFKILQKMGYKAGSSLGKMNQGIKEPVDVVIKVNAFGVGREEHMKEVTMKMENLKDLTFRELESKFRAANVEKFLFRTLTKDYLKAKRICEEFDARHDVMEPLEDFFWTEDTILKLRNAQALENTEDNENGEDTKDEATEEKLKSIINYLRGTYFYCMYCATIAISKSDLACNCPGPYRDDHDTDSD